MALNLPQQVTRKVLLAGALCNAVSAYVMLRHLMEHGLRRDVHHAYPWVIVLFACIIGLVFIGTLAKYYTQRDGIAPRYYTHRRVFQGMIILLGLQAIVAVFGLAAQNCGLPAAVVFTAVLIFVVCINPWMTKMSRAMRTEGKRP